MKNLVQGLFQENAVVAGFIGAIVGLVLGTFACLIIAEGFYNGGGIPVVTALIATLSPMLVLSFLSYSFTQVLAWALTKEKE